MLLQLEFFFISEKILRSSDFGDNKSTRTQPSRILIRIGRDDHGILQEVQAEFILEKQMTLIYIKMEHLLNAPKIWPKVINGIMNILNQIETIIILLSNWFEIVRFFESMPYFSYQTIQKYRKFPRVSIIISETINSMISPGPGMALIFVSEWLKFMMVFKLQLSKATWYVKFFIKRRICQLRSLLKPIIYFKALSLKQNSPEYTQK